MRRLVLWLAASMLGCAPTLEEQVAGTWAVDADAWLADPSLRALPAEVRRSLDPIARSMVAEARFTFESDRCARIVAGRIRAVSCVADGQEKGALVLRETAPDGLVDWIRLWPEGDRMRMIQGSQSLPLRRADAAEAGPDSVK